MRFLMQARSSVTKKMVTWLVPEPDWMGDLFPGDGTPQFIAATQLDFGTTLDIAGLFIVTQDGRRITTQDDREIVT